MKAILHFFFLLMIQSMFCQSNETENIFWDLIDVTFYPEEISELGYVKKVTPSMLESHLNIFKKESSLQYYDNPVKKTESIILTKKEKDYLISELSKSEIDWDLSTENKLVEVDYEDILEFLKADRNRELRIISKPIFIRDKTIACLFSTHLCCGRINGHQTLCLYKKIDGKWKRWIHLTHGDF